MKKFVLLILIMIYNLYHTYAWSNVTNQNLTYNFIIWKVWEVNISTLEKNPYYSLEEWVDKRKYYIFDLEYYKYITQNWDETSLLNKGVHIYNNEFDLDFLYWEYRKWQWYRPQKWDYIISIYNINRDNTFDNQEIYDLYLKNWILKSNYINTDISRVINCDNYSSDFLSYIWESISLPNDLYKTEEEKTNLQNNIIKKVIDESWICWKKDSKNEIKEVTYFKEKNNTFYYYLLWISIILSFFILLLIYKKLNKWKIK